VITLVSNARAENEQTLTVSSKVPPMDGVSRAYVVVGDATSVMAVAPLTYVEPPQGKNATLVGRLRISSEPRMLGLLFSVMNPTGEVRSVYREYKAEELPMVTRLSTSQLSFKRPCPPWRLA